jgi:hypothetical protein
MVTSFANDVRQLARVIGSSHELQTATADRLELSARVRNLAGIRPVSKPAMSKAPALEAVDAGALAKILAERERLRAFRAHEHSAIEQSARIEEAGHICPVLRLVVGMSIRK